MKRKLTLGDALLCAALLFSFALLLYATYGSPMQARTASVSPSPPSSTPSAEIDAQNALCIDVLDVGQGSCALLRGPNGKTMLIDAGDTKYAAAVASFLREQKIDKLDIAVATHPHKDHIGSMAALIREFQPSTLLLPDISGDLSEYNAMLRAACDVGAALSHPGVEQAIPWDEAVSVTAFAPFAGLSRLKLDVNEQSVLLRVCIGNTSILFTGDAGYEAEQTLQKLLPKRALRSSVLTVGHHGSSDATTPRFLHAVSPSFAVISCGVNNDYGHPDQSVLNLLAQKHIQVFRTDTQGNVRILMDGVAISVATEKEW